MQHKVGTGNWKASFQPRPSITIFQAFGAAASRVWQRIYLLSVIGAAARTNTRPHFWIRKTPTKTLQSKQGARSRCCRPCPGIYKMVIQLSSKLIRLRVDMIQFERTIIIPPSQTDRNLDRLFLEVSDCGITSTNRFSKKAEHYKIHRALLFSASNCGTYRIPYVNCITRVHQQDLGFKIFKVCRGESVIEIFKFFFRRLKRLTFPLQIRLCK